MIEFRNLTHTKIHTKLLKKIAEKIFANEKVHRGDLSIAFLGSKRMKKINQLYRAQDYTPDVLSFPGGDFWFGEILLCPNEIRKNAKKYGITFEEQLARIFIHGVLHLLGYNHIEMRKKEQYYFLKFFNKDVS